MTSYDPTWRFPGTVETIQDVDSRPQLHLVGRATKRDSRLEGGVFCPTADLYEC